MSQYRIQESVGFRSGKPIFTVQFQPDEDHPGYPLWEDVDTFGTRELAEAYVFGASESSGADADLGRPIPLPGDVFGLRTVVASCNYFDDERGVEHLLLLLNPAPPYFTVAHIAWPESGLPVGDEAIVNSEDHFNIVPAVDAYQQWGGDN